MSEGTWWFLGLFVVPVVLSVPCAAVAPIIVLSKRLVKQGRLLKPFLGGLIVFGLLAFFAMLFAYGSTEAFGLLVPALPFWGFGYVIAFMMRVDVLRRRVSDDEGKP